MKCVSSEKKISSMHGSKEDYTVICTCDRCLFTFFYNSFPATCPDCGAKPVREATPEEKDWYYDIQQEKQNNPLLLDKVG